MSGPRRLAPGTLAVEYATRLGWGLRARNLLLEGDSDVRYLLLADDLYFQKSNMRLIGRDFGCFAAGSGDAGGVDGIERELPPLRRVIDNDLDANSALMFKVVALFDDDEAGRRGAISLSRRYNLKLGKDYLLLRRQWPIVTTEPILLAKHLQEGKADVDTEIEDLLSRTLIDGFFEEYPEAKARIRTGKDGLLHLNLADIHKGHLWLFTKANAVLADVEGIVSLLRAVRFYCGLPLKGI